MSEGEHGAAGVGRTQGTQRPHGGIDIDDDDGGERLAERRLDRPFPARLDAQEVEQRAEHAVAPGELLGAGASMGGVEGELQRLDASLDVGECFGRLAAARDARRGSSPTR